MDKQEKKLTAAPLLAHADLWFWIAFLLFNVLLVLPKTLLFLRGIGALIALEFSFLFLAGGVIVSRLSSKGKKTFLALFLLFFYANLIYTSYANILRGFYQMEPNFYNDRLFIASGLPFLLESLQWSVWIYLLAGSGLALFLALIGYGARQIWLKQAPRLGRISRIAAGAFGMGLLLYSGIFFQMEGRYPSGIDSFFAEIKQNWVASRQSAEAIETFVAQNPYEVYDYHGYDLAEKPNVYFIAIESYGSVLYKRDHFLPAYEAMANRFEEELNEAGWHAVSTLSRSPTWGGGSWMAYTSALFGVEVSEQSQYEALREKYARLPYPNMGRYFHQQGYEYWWVVPISRRLPEELEEKNRAFYGADRWLTYENFAYEGPLYGWGPSPPDQYTFGVLQEELKAQDQPIFLFFLTQDSHYPWTPLPPHVENWSDLNTLDEKGGTLTEEEKDQISVFASRQNYLQALNLSFENLSEFITNLNDPNAVIILLGDHQPPTVSRPDDGYTTMLHILSQDQAFLDRFLENGFQNGIFLSNMENQITHAGFYSLFIRHFFASYGVQSEKLPAYLPLGMQ